MVHLSAPLVPGPAGAPKRIQETCLTGRTEYGHRARDGLPGCSWKETTGALTGGAKLGHGSSQRPLLESALSLERALLAHPHQGIYPLTGSAVVTVYINTLGAQRVWDL